MTPKQEKLAYNIRVWWNDRIVAGCQLSNLENFKEGYDYFTGDEGTWFRLVAKEAMHACYSADTGNVVHYTSFVQVLHNALGYTETLYKVGKIELTPNQPYKKRRAYLRFWKAPLTVLPL